MSFPLSLLLIPYILLLFFYFIMSLIYCYHLVRYSFFHLVTLIFLTFYIAASVGIFMVSLNLILGIDWKENIALTPQI